MTSASGRRVTSPPSLAISPSITSTAGSATPAITAVDSGGIALPRAASASSDFSTRAMSNTSAHQGAGAPADEDADRAAQNADEHPDQRTARRPDEADVVGALGDAQLARRRALDDGRGPERDATLRVTLLEHAQRLVRLARLREPNDDHVFHLSHCSSFRSNCRLDSVAPLLPTPLPRRARPLP